MRRKSERTSSKKKASPEKKEKPEKVKKSRTSRRNRKHSSSSESESTEDNTLKQAAQVSQTESTIPPKPAKEESPEGEESQEQVWHVKTTETSGDIGEIQKLKICLARPPSTPERADRSPRSKRKHSRATSSSDTQSVEGEEKKKTKHRSKKSTESKELVESNKDSKDESHLPTPTSIVTEPESTEAKAEVKESDSKTSVKPVSDDTPMSTTNEDTKDDTVVSTQNIESDKKNDNEAEENDKQNENEAKNAEGQNENEAKNTDNQNDNEEKNTHEKNENEAENTEKENENEAKTNEEQNDNEGNNIELQNEAKNTDKPNENKAIDTEKQGKKSDADTTVVSPKPPFDDDESGTATPKDKSPERNRSVSVEKSEILELHAEDSHCESTEIISNKSQETNSNITADQDNEGSNIVTSQVSNNETITEMVEKASSSNENTLFTTNKNVVESTKSIELEKKSEVSNDLNKEVSKDSEKTDEGHKDENNQNIQEVLNGQTTPLVINRKRRWGSRPSRLSTQKSITISTDVLKEIIPDVKPAEFDEVIEEKKHKRVEVPEKIDRPVLPKIVIDNTEHIEMNKDQKVEDKDKENVKSKETNIANMRKISIVKDNDSIITRPPSPPRHKQSNILYITNLVRPFTLPQLKNLLQRTGRIVENEFWIDRIKSKCFVKYENEDQAVETRHALHGVTWPVSNPKTLHVDFSTQEDFDKAKANEDTDNSKQSTIPGTVEDWLREQDIKREKGELEKPWERKVSTREWDVGKNDKGKDVERPDKERDDRPMEKRRHRTPERSPEPARKFKKKEEPPAKLLDDLFRKTKTTPCIYWLPLSAETIAVKEEQRRLHMAEHERRLQELRRTHRRH